MLSVCANLSHTNLYAVFKESLTAIDYKSYY